MCVCVCVLNVTPSSTPRCLDSNGRSNAVTMKPPEVSGQMPSPMDPWIHDFAHGVTLHSISIMYVVPGKRPKVNTGCGFWHRSQEKICFSSCFGNRVDYIYLKWNYLLGCTMWVGVRISQSELSVMGVCVCVCPLVHFTLDAHSSASSCVLFPSKQ